MSPDTATPDLDIREETSAAAASPRPPAADRLWAVVGASSPVARAFARRAAAAGADVLLAGRDLDDLGATAADVAARTGRRADVLRFDAADPSGHGAFADACVAAAAGRRLDLLFAVGDMPDQDRSLADPALARRVFETNLLGAVSLIQRLVPAWRERGEGAVVVLGSVAGDRGRRKNFVYGAAKAGLHAFLQGLRGEFAGTRVRVVTVKPGFLDTAMTWGRPGVFLAASPDVAAAACLRAAERGPEVVYVPRVWRPVMYLLRAVPEPVFKRLPI